MPEQQAKAEAEALRDVLAEALDTTLATKADIDRLERKLLEHDGRFAVADAKMDKVAWMLGIVIALAIANFAKQFF